MIAGAVNEQYRCLMEILTCLVCKEMVNKAHLCPNCSKFYCLHCIDRQLEIEEKCLNCNRHLNKSMLSNCEQLCRDLTDTMERVKLRTFESRRGQDKSPYYCYRHKLQKTYYCQTCHKPLCSDCSVLTETHRGHEFIKLSLMKTQFKQKISQKQEQINAYIHKLDSRIKSLNEERNSSQQMEHESLSTVEFSMKSLKDQLKKRLKKILREGQKKLDLFNEAVQKWNQCYESQMKILKSTSKGKFVQKQYNRLSERLIIMLEEACTIQETIRETKEETKKQNVNIDYLNPEYHSFVFTLSEFSHKQQSDSFFYTQSVITQEGLQIRLKIYPNGIPEEQSDNTTKDPKMTKKHSKNEDYLAIFIELVDGPVRNTKQKHQLILNPQKLDGRPFIREFQSEFDVGLCWGYQHFIKLNTLFDEGYYDSELDLVEVTLNIAPCNYYQASKDQLQLLKVKYSLLESKRRHCEQLQKLVTQKQIGSTCHSIEAEAQRIS